MTSADLPPVTDAHRRAAFAAMGVHGLSFDAAMRHPTWPRVIECAATRLRTRIWRAQQCPAPQTTRRYDPATGQ